MRLDRALMDAANGRKAQGAGRVYRRFITSSLGSVMSSIA